MKKSINLICLLLVLCLTLSILFACGDKCESLCPDCGKCTDANCTDHKDKCKCEKDYAGSLSFDPSDMQTKKVQVQVQTYIDGDTTHFLVVGSDSQYKARYIAVDTPESTGTVEPYGTTAKEFTHDKLANAEKIYLESDDGNWNLDSTSTRFVVWVWYLPKGSTQYRNLNIELLQNGMANPNKSANNRYGAVCTAAIAQAKAQKLAVYSGEKDPRFYYGDAYEITLKELRTNLSKYDTKKVAFEAVIAREDGATRYVEAFDEETGLYFGIQVYLGYNLKGEGLEIMSVGNRVRIVGNVQNFNGTYQISDIKHFVIRKDPSNLVLLESGLSAANTVLDAKQFVNGKVNVEILLDKANPEDPDEEERFETKTFDYAQMIMHTTVSMANLKVVSVKEAASGSHELTFTCSVDGVEIKVHTNAFKNADNTYSNGSEYVGKTISVVGFVDYFYGYQLAVISQQDITIQQN